MSGFGTRADQLARSESVFSSRLDGETDPPYVTATENYFGWDHERMYRAAQSIDGHRIRELAEAFNDIAAHIPFGLGVAFLTSTIRENWEGAAADRALETVGLLGDQGIEFRDSISVIAVKLHRLHECVDSIRMAVPPPDIAATESLSGFATESLSGFRQQAVHEDREDARQAAALALTNLCAPPYRAAGSAVPVFPGPGVGSDSETVVRSSTPATGVADAVVDTVAEEEQDPSSVSSAAAGATSGLSAPPPAITARAPADVSTRAAAAGTPDVAPLPPPDAPPARRVFQHTVASSPSSAPVSGVTAAAPTEHSATPFRRTPAPESAPSLASGAPAVRGASASPATGRAHGSAPGGGALGRVGEHRVAGSVPDAVPAGAAPGGGIAASPTSSSRPSPAVGGGHLMAPGARGMARDDDTEHKTPSYLVSIDNGSELIGRISPVGPPVIG